MSMMERRDIELNRGESGIGRNRGVGINGGLENKKK